MPCRNEAPTASWAVTPTSATAVGGGIGRSALTVSGEVGGAAKRGRRADGASASVGCLRLWDAAAADALFSLFPACGCGREGVVLEVDRLRFPCWAEVAGRGGGGGVEQKVVRRWWDA